MIVDNGKYYLYRHIRLDTNQPFYVGIGTKPENYVSYKREYIRAFNKTNRNILWKRVVNKTDYRIEIILESDSREFVEEKEIEFIKLYGRKNINTGILTNLSDGGEGNQGVVWTREQVINICVPVYQYDLDGMFIKKFDCMTDVEKELNIKVCDISQAIKNSTQKRSRHTAGGFQWRNNYYESISIYNKLTALRHVNAIVQKTLDGEFITEWKSVSIASRTLNLGRTAIVNCLNGWSVSSFGYIWEYKTDKNKESKEKRLSEKSKKENLYLLHQYDLDFNLIKTFSSVQQASKELGFHATSITNYFTRGGKHAKGFIWKKEYLTEIKQQKENKKDES